MAKTWNEIRGNPNPDLVERERAEAVRELHEHSLAELRAAQALTQAELARTLGTTQSAVSQIERQSDPRLSTLYKYVDGIGGRLILHVEFAEEGHGGGTILRVPLDEAIAPDSPGALLERRR